MTSSRSQESHRLHVHRDQLKGRSIRQAKIRIFLGSYYSSFVALNIKDEETDRLARELAAETGQSITEALRQAIVAQLERVRRANRSRPSSELDEVIQRGRARTVLDRSDVDEILGYGEDGLPA